MKEKLFTSYKIGMASLILFTTQAIFSVCKIYGQFAGACILLNSPIERVCRSICTHCTSSKQTLCVVFSARRMLASHNSESGSKGGISEEIWKKKKTKGQLGNWYFDAFIKLKVSGFQQFLCVWQLGLRCYELHACLNKDWLPDLFGLRHQTKKETKRTKPSKPFRQEQEKQRCQKRVWSSSFFSCLLLSSIAAFELLM